MSTPVRQGTGSSSTAAVPDQQGDIAILLLERLDAWKHATGYLEDYVEATAHQYKGWSKDYDKVLKTVSDPLKEGHHFSQNNGGIATMFENIRSNTMAIANSQVETEKALKSTVLPQLNRLHTEIKHKYKELSSGAGKDSKIVDKARATTQKQIEHLGQHTASFESAGGKIEPTNDPYIIQRGVFHSLHKQLMDENHHRRDLLDIQNNFLTFERHVVQTIQAAMAAFYQTVSGQNNRTNALYGDIATTSQNVPPEFEWTNFTSRHGEVLINPATPDRTLDMVSFPNQDHASTKPLVQGLLQRKGKIMRSYNTAHYAVTPAGFFHEFKESNDFKESPEPEMSLYLPDCTIGAPPTSPEGNFNISGKDANKSITTKHEFQFKANSYDEAMKFYQVISQFTTGHLTRQNSLASPTSPTAAAGTAGIAMAPIPASEKAGFVPHQQAGIVGGEKAGYLPQVNTNVTNTATMASPATTTPHSAAVPYSATQTVFPANTPMTGVSGNGAGTTAMFHGKS